MVEIMIYDVVVEVDELVVVCSIYLELSIMVIGEVGEGLLYR